MGAWGSGLYANDGTCDVRNTYMSCLKDGQGNLEAYHNTLEMLNDFIGDEDEPLLWFALAETQWKTGRLLPEVKEKALYWIEKEGGIELWEESASGGLGWKKTLQNLKKKLESPMPNERKIRKYVKPSQNLWNLHDIYAYQFHGKWAIENGVYGKYMILQKIGEGINRRFSDDSDDIMMRIQVLDEIFDILPSLENLNGIRILPLDIPYRIDMNENQVLMSCLMILDAKSSYPAKYLSYIGNRPGPTNINMSYNILDWWDIDNWLFRFHQDWQGKEYETLEEGVFRYTN